MRVTTFALLACVLFACSSDDDSSLVLGGPAGTAGAAGGPATKACVAGKQETCPCLDGLGVQRCRDDGSGYDSCVCPGDGGAGTAGEQAGGGTGGKGGSAGASTKGGSGGTGGTGGSGGTGGTSGMGASGGASGNGSGACQGKAKAAVRVPSDIVLLTDKSGSMAEGPEETGGPPKWSVLPPGLDAGIGKEDTGARLGMMLFPAGKFDENKLTSCFLSPQNQGCDAILKDGGCNDVDPVPVVGLSAIPAARTAIAEALKAQSPSGGTPIRTALGHAWAHLAKAPGAQERAVILLTDGQPQTFQAGGGGSFTPSLNQDCGTLSDLEEDTAKAANGVPNVRTFVIVLPGNAELATMSGLAVRGKTGKDGCTLANYQTQECHYQLQPNDYATKLGTAVADAIGRASRGCVFETNDDVVATPEAASVLLDGAPLPRDASRTEGWDYVGSGAKQIEIFGAACSALRDSATAKVELAVDCPQ